MLIPCSEVKLVTSAGNGAYVVLATNHARLAYGYAMSNPLVLTFTLIKVASRFTSTDCKSEEKTTQM